MPETLNSMSQMQTKKEAAAEQQNPEVQEQQTPVTAQKQERKAFYDENVPTYNPLLGDTPAKYAAAISGSDQEHPLFTVDQFGFAKFHPENITHQKGPASLQFDPSTGAWDVEGRRKALNNHIDSIANEIAEYQAVMAPEFARSQDRNNAAKRTIAGAGEFVGHTASSFWSMFLNGGIGVMAQDRNFAELQWSLYKSKHENDPAFIEAARFLQRLEEDPEYRPLTDENGQYLPDAFEFQKALAFSERVQDKYGLSEGAKEVLSTYQKLVEKRDEDERRMMIGVAFDESESDLSGWVNSKMDITEADNEESVMMTLGKFSGDVTGSLFAAWLTARAGTGIISGVGNSLSRAQQVVRGAEAINAAATAAEGGATAALAASASMSEKLITIPIFLSQYNQIRTESLLAGKGINEANAIGMLAGAAEAGWEWAGFKFFKRFYRADGILRNYILRNIFPEALQEGVQTGTENLITEAFGVTDKQWTDIMYEIGMSMIAGAIGGGVFTFGRFREEGAAAWLENVNESFKNKLTDIAFADIDTGVNLALETADIIDESVQGELTSSEAAAINKERARLKEEYNKLTADQKKAHDEFAKAYKELKAYYEAAVKKVNPDIKKAELNRGFQAIKVMTQLQKQGNILVNHYYAAVNTMVSYLDKSGKMQQYNIKQIKKKMFDHGMTRKQVEALTSKDAIERNNAQWDLAENHIANDLMSQGVSETEAKMSARFTRAIASEATLLNPSITPLSLVKKMHANVMNIQNAVLFKMDLPARFAPVTDKFLKYGYVNAVKTKTAFRFLNKVADVLLNDKPAKSEVRDINEKLFGNQTTDPNLDALRALALTQAEMIQKIIEKMPTKLNVDYSQKDFITMFLLNRLGMSWTEIFGLYNIEMKGNRKDVDKYFNLEAKEQFRKPTEENLKRLNSIATSLDSTFENKYNVEEKALAEEASGFYEKEQNLIVLNNPKPGTAFHEYGHFALTTLITNQLQLAELGLLPDSSPLYGIYNRLHKRMEQEGKVLTERQFQETVLDATMKVIEYGQANDPVLTGLLTMLKAQGYSARKKLAGSLLNDSSGRELTKEGKKGIRQEVADIINGLTPSNILQRAYDLRNMSMFRGNFDPTVSNKANNKKMITQMAEEATNFLKTIPVKDTDTFFIAISKVEKQYEEAENAEKKAIKEKNDAEAEKARVLKANTLLGMAMLAERISSQAIDFATDVLCENEEMGLSLKNETDVGPHLWRNGGIFFEADAAALPADMAPGFRPDIPILESIKKSWPGIKEVAENIVNSIKRYTQSLEGAAGEVSDHLRDIIMREVWQQSMSIQAFREAIAPCVQAYDAYWKKLSKAEKSKEGIEWRQKFHAVLGTSRSDSRAKAAEFLKSKLGAEALTSWNNAMDMLDGNEEKFKSMDANDPKRNLYKGVRNLMTEAGIDASIFEGLEYFFPMAVENYSDLTQDVFGHSYTYNSIDKMKDRLTKEYIKKHGKKDSKGNVTITKEQEAELQTILSDAINSQFQRNVNDENKVTAFFKRTVFDYTKNPEMLRYYKDPFTTLDHYMDAAYRTVMMRNLIGRVQYDKNGKPILDNLLSNSSEEARGKIGQFFAQNGALSGEAVERFRQIMHDFVTRDSGNRSNIFNLMREINSFTTLGSIFSTLNQIQDIEFCFTMFGLKPTAKAIKEVLFDSEKTTKLTDIGGETSNEMFRPGDQTTMQKITKKVYAWTQFEKADRAVKEVAINAFSNWAQEVLAKNVVNIDEGILDIKNNDQVAAFDYILDEIYPKPDSLVFANNMTEEQMEEERKAVGAKRGQIIRSFINGESTPETKYVQWFMLTKMQPMNAAAVPGAYNSAGPLGKLMYQFNTVAIRQMGFLGDYFKWQSKVKGPWYASIQMAKFAAFALGVGVPKELLEAILKGQKPQITNMILSPLHVFMINSYVTSVAKREGLFKASISAYTPKFGSFDNVTKDAWRVISGDDYKGFTFKSVPFVGMPMWYWLFGGRQAAIKQDVALFHKKYQPKDSIDRKVGAAAKLRFLEGKDND